jgi:hypothetical protein
MCTSAVNPGGIPLTKSAKSASVFEGEQVEKGGKTMELLALLALWEGIGRPKFAFFFSAYLARPPPPTSHFLHQGFADWVS